MSSTQTPDNELFRSVGDGTIESRVIAQRLRVNKTQLAGVLGIGVESLRRSNRERARSVQTRMRDMIEIINRVQTWAGSVNQAFAWYRSQYRYYGDMILFILIK